MFLLIRQISPYTGADVLLGDFLTAEDAETMKAAYANRYRIDPNLDPWRNQADKDSGLSDDDLAIEEIANDDAIGDDVFVVSSYEEGFGQVIRKFGSSG